MFLLAVFVIPALMLTWGFAAEAERLGTRTRLLAKRQGVQHISDTSNSSSNAATASNLGGISTSDEEYLEIIGDDNYAQSGKNASSLDKVESLVIQVETLEQNISITNIKLDLILNEKRSTRLSLNESTCKNQTDTLFKNIIISAAHNFGWLNKRLCSNPLSFL